MWWTLVACAPEVPGTVQTSDLPGDDWAGASGVRALPLPEAPFTARTRLVPTTLVDKHGAPLLVLEHVGVEVEVSNLLADRAYVTCTGCRAPLDAWIQRQGLHVGTEATGGPHDDLLAFLAAQENLPEVAGKGFLQVGGDWVAPPWYDEGGYEGEVVRVRMRDGYELVQ